MGGIITRALKDQSNDRLVIPSRGSQCVASTGESVQEAQGGNSAERSRNRGTKQRPVRQQERKAEPREQLGLGSGRHQRDGDSSNDQQAGTTRGHMHTRSHAPAP